MFPARKRSHGRAAFPAYVLCALCVLCALIAGVLGCSAQDAADRLPPGEVRTVSAYSPGAPAGSGSGSGCAAEHQGSVRQAPADRREAPRPLGTPGPPGPDGEQAAATGPAAAETAGPPRDGRAVLARSARRRT
ncbi:hypothetical protein [Streptomyces yaizuensis]|uniref:Collagen-like protein n=1 Tax=Streptomyces yaizuensis TaxID=2989713 RepID=A0ABQ5NZT4_9ACTN|nr:hypothetical protein [Streptomyces sp. YSPA8]GLF95869.1 hypothetical protein SYYSPA8_16250 [Streptomyces sp. YSPA8]